LLEGNKLWYIAATLKQVQGKEVNRLKFQEASGEQIGRENEPLSHLTAETEIEKLASFEAGLGERKNETLFKITAEIEDIEKVLKQAEQLVQRLKKRLQQLKELQRVLSK